MRERNFEKSEKTYILLFTITIAILVLISSSIGIFYSDFYSAETVDWRYQSIGQDISNLIIVVPTLLISVYFMSKGSKGAKIIWCGTMITNIYSYVIYTFAVHFNFLFHIYCLILGLSLYSIIIFFKNNINENFNVWFNDKIQYKSMGIFLFIIASLFLLLWLSQSLPSALVNKTPDNIISGGLLTNPVHALDFSFYLPLMFIAAMMIFKRRNSGYILAPMMMTFAIITNINIISLMVVTMVNIHVNNIPPIIIFSILTCICIVFLLRFLNNISKNAIKKFV